MFPLSVYVTQAMHGVVSGMLLFLVASGLTLGNVRLMSKPSDLGQLVTTLGKGEEMIFLGKEEEGFLQVESSKGSGWVKKILIAR